MCTKEGKWGNIREGKTEIFLELSLELYSSCKHWIIAILHVEVGIIDRILCCNFVVIIETKDKTLLVNTHDVNVHKT